MIRGNIRIYFIKSNNFYYRASKPISNSCYSTDFLISPTFCKIKCDQCNLRGFNHQINFGLFDMVAIPVRFMFLINEKEI